MKNRLIILVIGFIVSTQAQADIKEEIITRCRSQMSDYGSALVKACVDQDLEALPSLVEYKDKYPKLFNRCLTQMKKYGYSMVKACVDQDIEAEDALRRY
jgi:hypothetical protein